MALVDAVGLGNGDALPLYRVENETVQVARILDGRQDYLHVLFGMAEEK